MKPRSINIHGGKILNPDIFKSICMDYNDYGTKCYSPKIHWLETI